MRPGALGGSVTVHQRAAQAFLVVFEIGSSVVAECFDDHHRTHLRKCLKERAVESLVVGSAVFREETLQARALELNVAAEKKKIKDDNKEDPEPKSQKKRKKERKSEKSKKAASSEDSSKADSSSEESSSDESSPSKKKKKKKSKAD